jgi:hypothetical protein
MSRALVAMFYELPYSKTCKLMREFGASDEEMRLPDHELHKAVFTRIRESGRIGELQCAIEKLSGKQLPPRLGDYYTNLDLDSWRTLLFTSNLDASDIVSVASCLFLGSAGSPPKASWLNAQRAVLLADAFAHGALKYGKVGDWRAVPLDHHIQAAGRHFDAWLKDNASLDAESGLTHEAHFLARAVMIQELRRTK